MVSRESGIGATKPRPAASPQHDETDNTFDQESPDEQNAYDARGHRQGLAMDSANGVAGILSRDTITMCWLMGLIMSVLVRSGVVCVALAAFAVAATGESGAQQITTIFNFNNHKNRTGKEGAGPNPLIFDSSGNLYGTAGGNPGSAYELVQSGGSWTFKLLKGFKNAKDGFAPDSVLTAGPAGVYYGTTSGGGSDGAGTIFELAPDGSKWKCYSGSELQFVAALS
jgi:uncharacterized repeat protein (TIGR03803 family)